jgi:nucleotide-binding universal stress UspA family protein
MFKKIVVPLDGSTLAEKALPYAETLAQQFEGELILVWVLYRPVLVPVDFTAAVPPIDTLIAQEGKVAREYLNQLEAQLQQRQIACRTVVLESVSVAEAIIDLASREEADLIVKTTHGRSGPSRWLLGNVALKVLQGAPCPVFLVRVKAGEPPER